jgi:hypothetical protein
MSPQSSYGAWGNNTVSWIQTRTSFVEIPEMNLNNIGNANDLANLTGTFVSYHYLSNIGLFVTQTSTGFETVKTISAPIIQTIESPTETSRDITWTPEENGVAVVEKYAILLDGVIIQDDISKDTFTYSLTNLDANTDNELFTVRKFTNLINLDSNPKVLPPGEYLASGVTLKVNYDFSTGTLDELTTSDPAYTFTANTNMSFVELEGATWLEARPYFSLKSYIGPLLPLRNITYQMRYNLLKPDYSFTRWFASFGEDPSSAELSDLFRTQWYTFSSTNPDMQAQVQPDPLLHGYTEKNNTTISGTRANAGWNGNSKPLAAEGRVLTPEEISTTFGGDHVWTVVYNQNQTGTDLAAQPGEFAIYIDNKLIVKLSNDNRINTWIGLDHDFVWAPDRTFYVRDQGYQTPNPFYFGGFKFYDGVVNMRMLNELPPLL